MNLYVVRHAEARPVGGDIILDDDRPLTDEGVKVAEVMGSMLARVDLSIGLIMSSPFVRARQTGRILADQLRPGMNLRISENLAPGFRARLLLKELSALDGETGVIVVGHQPDMSSFVSTVIADSAHAAIAMATGAVAKIVLEPAGRSFEARLEWLITPDLLKGISTGG